MTRACKPKKVNLLTRSALGPALASWALALGIAAGGAMVTTPALAAKPSYSFSKGFQQAAGPLQKALGEARSRADVTAAKQKVASATTDQARAAAKAELASALAPEKAMLEAAYAAVENEDDRFVAGNLALSYGGLADDPATQRRGLEGMLQSGKVPEADVPKFRFYAGQTAYMMGDYAAAASSLKAAYDVGYRENNVEAILAEAYLANNQTAQGLAVLRQGVDQYAATGKPAPVSWYRRGLGAAYKAGSVNDAVDFGSRLVKAYPAKEHWGGVITVVREIGKYSGQEMLDLLRLMARTNSFAEERDYVEYIQAIDPRRLPGEALKAIDAGIASGKLKAADSFVADARSQANGRLATDKGSLASYERDARASGAKEVAVTGAADALLSYGDPAKAEELYQIALGKPGVDTARVLTRLGIAQADQGKYAEAQATLAKVTGVRKPIANLWSVYAASKAAPAAQ